MVVTVQACHQMQLTTREHKKRVSSSVGKMVQKPIAYPFSAASSLAHTSNRRRSSPQNRPNTSLAPSTCKRIVLHGQVTESPPFYAGAEGLWRMAGELTKASRGGGGHLNLPS